MAKANIKELEGLHKLVTDYYGSTIAEALENGEELSSGFLGAVNTHLKNNDITVDIVESSPMQNLSYRIQDLIKQEEEAM